MPVDLMDTGAFTSPSPEGQGAVHLPPFVLGNLYTGLMYRGMFCSSMAALLAWECVPCCPADDTWDSFSRGRLTLKLTAASS